MTGTSMLDVTQLTVTAAADLIADGVATPSELLESYLDRIDAVGNKVQAWSYLDVAGAREAAAQLTQEAAAGRRRGPLHGVPVGVKDEFHVAGMPTYFADPAGRPQPEDATAVALLRQAGAIIVGK